MENKVLVIVINFNGEEDTLACIHSLLNQDYPNYHIALLDNHSDDIRRLVSEYDDHPKISLIKSQVNLGFAKGNNKVLEVFGERLSDFSYVALLNNDAVAHSDWLSQLVECAQRTSSDQVASKILNHQKPEYLDNVGHQFISTGEIVPIGFGARASDFNQEMETAGSCAAANLYSVKMLSDIGFFDPYFDTGYEDAELGLRAVISGYKCTYCPKAIVSHKISQSVSAVDDLDYRIRQQVNIYYSYFKLMPIGVICLNLPSIIVKYILVILVELLTLRWSYIGIHLKTVKQLFTNRNLISKGRKSFTAKTKLISTFQIWRKQRFFLWFDIGRLFTFVGKNQKTVFDRSMHK